MQEILLESQVPAPPDAVWTVFTDHVGWERWAGVREVVLRQRGDPPPNGLGAIRVIRSNGVAIEEEITFFDPPQRMSYRLVGGLPVHDYSGEVRLEPSEGGTAVRWSVRFRPWVPGTGRLLRLALERTLGSVLERLAGRDW